MEGVAAVASIIAIVQTWNEAVQLHGLDTQHQALLSDYSFTMCVLEDCVSNINAAGNELMTPAINMAVKRCSNLAEQLAFRQVEVDRVGRVRKVIYKLNAWATLRSQYADFQDRVSFIHHLTQE